MLVFGVWVFWNVFFNKLRSIVLWQFLFVFSLSCVEFDVIVDGSLFCLGYLILLLKLVGSWWLIDLVFFECVLLLLFVGLKCFYVLLVVLVDFLLICGVIFFYDYYDYLDCVVIKVLVLFVELFLVLFGVGDCLLVWGVLLGKVC